MDAGDSGFHPRQAFFTAGGILRPFRDLFIFPNRFIMIGFRGREFLAEQQAAGRRDSQRLRDWWRRKTASVEEKIAIKGTAKVA